MKELSFMFDLYKRSPSTKTDRSPFSEYEKRTVFNKAALVKGYEAYSNSIRQDQCGAIIFYSEYGNTNSQYGWEIDHVNPVSNGGSDTLFNLQPLQWQNNRHKGDTVGQWYCKARG